MAGRPKLKIDRKYLNSFYYDRKFLQRVHNEFLFDSELKLLEIISKSNLTKMTDQDFEKFIKENLKLIKQCRYISNKKDKYETTIKYIEQKNKEILNDEELMILKMLDDHVDISDPKYFYQYLDIYSSSLNQQIKTIKYQNITVENRVIDDEKKRNRKQQNHQKIFIGGTHLALREFLNPKLDKDPTEIYIEMCKIYLMHTVFLNDREQLIAAFHQNQHLPIFDEISRKLLEIQNDPRNPFKKPNQ